MIEVSLYIATFIVLSGLLAMVDAGVLSVTRAEVEELAVQRKPGAVALRTAKIHMTRSVIIIVIVTNTINVLGPILIGQAATERYGTEVIGLITIILTLGTIIFSEIIPKSLGSHYAPLVGRISAPTILVLTYALYPLVIALERLTKLLHRGERPVGTEHQIRSLVQLGQKHGLIEQDESHMIRRTFSLNDRLAEDIMTPIDSVVSIRASTTIKEAAEIALQTEYSRYPLFGETNDDVQGVVLSRDIMRSLNAKKESEPISSIRLSALIVKHTIPADRLLMIFRVRHMHLAVVQKDSKTIGIVTLEDVLEELVGDIEDEKDDAFEWLPV